MWCPAKHLFFSFSEAPRCLLMNSNLFPSFSFFFHCSLLLCVFLFLFLLWSKTNMEYLHQKILSSETFYEFFWKVIGENINTRCICDNLLRNFDSVLPRNLGRPNCFQRSYVGLCDFWISISNIDIADKSKSERYIENRTFHIEESLEIE